MKKIIVLLIFIIILIIDLRSQNIDSSKWSMNYQLTTVTQYHPEFKYSYQGTNSLVSKENEATSLTTTLFIAYKPFKNLQLIFNPEIAGGRGLSNALGIAGFTNGECFRIGDPKPTIYIARALLEYYINLKGNKIHIDKDVNLVGMKISENYMKIFAGKFSMMDYVEKSIYSQDPRIHFLNWSFMTAGAWDYAANTRGYIVGAGIQAKIKKNTYTFIASQLPEVANGLELDNKINKAYSLQISLRRDFIIWKYKYMVEGIVFFNKANMGNYEEAINTANKDSVPDLTKVNNYKNTKYGIILNNYISFTNNFGIFIKLGWNDGKNQTWTFTPIDNSALIGFVKKIQTIIPIEIGSGYALNGISGIHKKYLEKGGLEFMLGDGKLNYSLENIFEAYFKITLWNQKIEITPHFVFIINPAYNKDRGPVSVFGIRTHIAF